MKNRKSPGDDNISNQIIKNLLHKGFILINKIINTILHLGHYPSTSKISKIIAIPKPGKLPNDPKNLRPISLLSSLSKLAELSIYDQLLDGTEKINLIPDEQFGFKRLHSTTHALCTVNE